MKHVTIIGTSLNSGSKSQTMATLFETVLRDRGVSCERIDLREMSLPFAGTREGWESSDADRLRHAVESSSHIVFAVPIYCYDVNSAAKNVIELIGRSFTGKVVSFICAAGGKSSYMAVMGMANHLMLDFRSVIVPRFLYVDGEGWSEEGDLLPEIVQRLERLADDMQAIQVVSVEGA